MTGRTDFVRLLIWFLALGTIAAAPTGLMGETGQMLAGSLLCRDQRALAVSQWLCGFTLPPELQVIGALAAIFLATRLLLDAVRRSRARAGKPGAKSSQVTLRRPRTRVIVRPKPRAHFGLRETRP